MELTEELWNELDRQQRQREAAAREKLCQDIAASDVPLPEELAAKIERVFITELRNVMRFHRGYGLAERRDSYRTWRVAVRGRKGHAIAISQQY